MTVSAFPQNVSGPAPAPFAPRHPADRNAILVLIALAWLGILMGFGTDFARHLQSHERPYPPIVHAHAAVFMGWLVLLTAQALLVRGARLDLHRRLGWVMAGLAVVMTILGPATAYTVQRLDFGTPDSNPSFISIQLTDILAFGGLVAAGILKRNDAAAHKRLVLLGTLYITDAGFARWLGGTIGPVFGHGPVGSFAADYACSLGLILAVGGYDLVTRHRLHPVYVPAVAWVLFNAVLAQALFFSPAWKPVAQALIGK